MTKNQVIFIHGGETFDTYKGYLQFLKNAQFDPYEESPKRWKHSLAEDLGDNFEVIMPSMPCKFNAKYKEWKIWFDKVVPHMRQNAVIVGHSLGGLFIVKYLAENNLSVKLRAVYLIAAPYNDDKDHSLADFYLPNNLQKFTKQTKSIFIYHSQDDPVVNFEESKKYKKALPAAQNVDFKDRNHFLQEEFTELIVSIKALF